MNNTLKHVSKLIFLLSLSSIMEHAPTKNERRGASDKPCGDRMQSLTQNCCQTIQINHWDRSLILFFGNRPMTCPVILGKSRIIMKRIFNQRTPFRNLQVPDIEYIYHWKHTLNSVGCLPYEYHDHHILHILKYTPIPFLFHPY